MGATSSFGNSNFLAKALAQDNQLTVNDVTYEGVYGEYYFDTGIEEKNIDEHFFPKYSYGISYDPLTKEKQEWLQVGLHSKYDGDGIKKYKRLPLELVIVLDISGSMGLCFDYGEGDENKSKIEIAKSSLLSLFKHLQDNDKLGIITFNTEGQILHNLTPWKNTNAEELKKKIMTIRADGGTTLEIGLTLAGTLLESYNDGVSNSDNNNSNNIEKRILFFTDMDPGFNGKDSDNLFSVAETLSKKSIYCTFFGIGLDFNAKLVQHITKNLRGSHYMTIHNSLEFNSVMDENFSYTVFPILFDLNLKLIPSDPSLSIKQICGSREADQSTGELVKVKTIFPSAKSSNQTKGGVILIQLKRKNEENDFVDAINNEGNTIINEDNNEKINTNTTTIINTNTNDNVNMNNNNPNNSNNSNNNNEIKLIVSYENRLTSQIEKQEITFHIPMINDDNNNGYYEIDGMKKSIILSQYVDFVHKIISINKNNENHKIINDIELFTNYFKTQIDIIGDDTMKRELNVLDKLKQSFSPPVSQQQ